MTTRFETLSAVRHLAQQGDWMVSCDLEDGYHVVGIHDSHQRYMTASLNGKLYSCAALPFGWSGSPAVFGKITKVLTQALRAPDLKMSGGRDVELSQLLQRKGGRPPLNLRVLPYCDDFLFFFRSREDALRGREQIQLTLDYLGLKRNPKKGDWEPTQRCRHLGLLVDTAKGLFVISPDKEAKICKMAKGVRVQALKNRRLQLGPVPRPTHATFRKEKPALNRSRNSTTTTTY